MGIDRTSGGADEPDADKGKEEFKRPDHGPPPQNTAEAAAETAENGKGKDAPKPSRETPEQPEQGTEPKDEDTPTKDRDESASKPEAADVQQKRDSDDHRPADANTSASPLERTPSYGGFANLVEEFDARAKSRELTGQYNAANDQPSEDGKRDLDTPELDEESIKNQIDPFAPDLDKAEGHKELFQRTVRDKDTEWTEGVDSFDDLPTGEKLAEGDEGERSKGENFRKTLFQGYGDAEDGVKKYTSTASDFFGPRPTGHAETRVDSGPTVADAHHSGIDPESTASSLLALGIVGIELVRWAREKIKERDTE